jgi:hypothetical protein
MIPMHVAGDLAEQHAADLRKLGTAGPRRRARDKSRLWPTRRAPRRLLARRRLLLASYAAAQR